jgi:mannosylglycerate hydrolase
VPQHDWVDLSDGQRGLCLISQGLPEYEVLDTPRREIAITLLRAVGYLGAGTELQTTSIGAGPNIATPEAQVQRQLSYSLALLPHAGRWDEAEVWRQALAHNNPPRALTGGLVKNHLAPPPGPLPARRSFLSVEGRNAILSAVKQAEQGDDLIVRLYNPSAAATQATLHLPFAVRRAQLAGLDEQPLPAAPVPPLTAEDTLQVDLPAGKIVTLRVGR